MKKNMGNLDRIIRVILAAGINVLYFTGKVEGNFGMALLILGGFLLATSFLTYSPIYAILGKSTRAKED